MSAKHSTDSDEPLAPCNLPASSCLIAQEGFREVRADISAIKVAVCGDPAMGHTGLIRRQEKSEADIGTIQHDIASIRIDFSKTKERVLGIVSGAAFVGSGVGVCIGILMDWMKRK